MRDDRSMWRSTLIALAATSLLVAGLAVLVYVGNPHTNRHTHLFPHNNAGANRSEGYPSTSRRGTRTGRCL